MDYASMLWGGRPGIYHGVNVCQFRAALEGEAEAWRSSLHPSFQLSLTSALFLFCFSFSSSSISASYFSKSRQTKADPHNQRDETDEEDPTSQPDKMEYPRLIKDKVFTTRLKMVIGKVISQSQIAFLSKKANSGWNRDLEKSYNSINQIFLDYTLGRLGFKIQLSKDLKQGDLLAPFLFLIVVEGLIGLMHMAYESGKISGLKISKEVQFSIIQLGR
ncbi:hypothetical protein CR513_42551, partial [Mucuna pruriens]